MKRALLLLLVVSAMLNCQRQGIIEPRILTTEFFVTDSLLLYEFIESSTSFQLNLPDEFPISGVRKIVPLDDRYLIQVQASRVITLMVFSKTGEYIRQVGMPGSGPQEIGYLTAFLYNERENTIEILDRQKKTIHILDTTGVYIMDRKPDAWPDDFSLTSQGDYLFYLPVGGTLGSNDSTLYPGIYLFSNKGQYIRHLSLAPFDNQFQVFGSSSFFGDQKEPYIMTTYDDYLYQFDGDSIHVKYFFDFGEKSLTQEDREENNSPSINLSFDHIAFKGNSFATKRYILFWAAFIGPNETGIALADLGKNSCRMYKKIHNDISDGEISIIGGSDNYFYGSSKTIIDGPNPEEITYIHKLKAKK
jgi:hypothetical protein